MDVRYARRLSEELLEAFEAVRKIEENSLNAAHGSSISPSESNLIEAVARGGERGVTISQIAAELSSTLASVTVGVNKLVHKGFLVKEKGAEDGRMVFVKLTREGRKVSAGHRYFQSNLVRCISLEFTDEELAVLIHALEKLNGFFRRNNYFYRKKLLTPRK